jgi:hypothetical protein
MAAAILLSPTLTKISQELKIQTKKHTPTKKTRRKPQRQVQQKSMQGGT